MCCREFPPDSKISRQEVTPDATRKKEVLMPKSKKLIIYQNREQGQLFLNATGVTEQGDFYLKYPPKDFGRVLPPSTTDEEIGRAVREVLKHCE